MPRFCRRHRVSVLANIVFGSLLLITLGLLVSQRLRFTDQPTVAVQKVQAPEEFFALSHDPNPLVDWHNYSQIEAESRRRGPGEHGMPVLLKPSEKTRSDRLYQVNGYNAFISDKISIRRSLRDIRHPACKARKYRRYLPTASIIVPFHQEHWSTLLRTFTTALTRAPDHLVKEIILVDDDSSKNFLKTPLERYLRGRFRNRVRVVRAPSRQGLIRARILGAANATGDVLVFLDSHCEPNINWLPPLLDPIAEDYRTVVCPLIDIVDYDTFEYRPQDEGARGAFDWELYYKRIPLQPSDIKHPSRPFESPVMAGGLFAISRKWFWELGGYDPGLDIWGGEQYELSFKVWQCGGRMFDAPCSRVGHVYRKFAPFPNNAKGDFVARNYKRVAEVWMDEYKEFIYKRRPHYRTVDTGDLTEQRAIRERLQCKPFSWYMSRVAFDLTKYYPPIEPPAAAIGSVRWLQDTRFCVDSKFRERDQSPILALCVDDNPGGRTGEQNFTMTFHKDVRVTGKEMCLDSPRGTEVILFPCHSFKGNQWWKYDPKTQQLRHVVSNKCLTGETSAWKLLLFPCDSSSMQQKWSWSQARKDILEKYLADDESE